jgi:ribosome-associated protein
MLRINNYTCIEETELSFTFSRSGGPGGQNVNKVNTRVTLHFALRGSPSLSETQRRRAEQALAGRIDREGRLRIVCDVHRTQGANRREAVLRFVEMLRAALRPPKVRRPTRPTAASRQARLSAKRRRSAIKRDRKASRRADEE